MPWRVSQGNCGGQYPNVGQVSVAVPDPDFKTFSFVMANQILGSSSAPLCMSAMFAYFASRKIHPPPKGRWMRFVYGVGNLFIAAPSPEE